MLFDVYSYGMIAPSTLHILSSPFPAAEGYAEIERTIRMTGGEALGSSLVLARLGRRNDAARTFEPYNITPVDTTGGGDAFRAGITFGILRGFDDLETVRFASALAAMVCSSFPGVLGCPRLEEINAFMARNPR